MLCLEPKPHRPEHAKKLPLGLEPVGYIYVLVQLADGQLNDRSLHDEAVGMQPDAEVLNKRQQYTCVCF